MFVQSAGFVDEHRNGAKGRLSIYGQERVEETLKLCTMNLAIHGLSGQIEYTHGGSLLDDAFPTLKADFVMANPPFNQSEWSTPAILDDARWAYGTPPTGNANYAWIQQFVFHLAPNGRAGFVMANGSLTPRRARKARYARISCGGTLWTASSRCPRSRSTRRLSQAKAFTATGPTWRSASVCSPNSAKWHKPSFLCRYPR
jgi:type I restriction-modification system DNA methylase subunit